MPVKRFSEKQLISFFNNIINVVLFCIQFFMDIFRYKDYYIKRADVIYIQDGIKCIDDITYEYRKGEKIIKSPDFLFRVKYFYNNKEYLYLTRNPNHVFPPVKKGMSFSLPVKEAMLLDANNVPIYNVTKHVKMYEGPFGDFHGETILLRDIEIEFPKIRLTNIMDTTVEYDITTGEINHQSLWLPSKT